MPFALVVDGNRKWTVVRLRPVGPLGVQVMTALAVPVVLRSEALTGMGSVPEQPANAKSTVTAVMRRSDDTVNPMGRPWDVVPAHVPLKSSGGVGRTGGAHAHHSRIAIPAANCHSSLVRRRLNRLIVV